MFVEIQVSSFKLLYLVTHTFFKRLAYTLTANCYGSKSECDATGCFVKALPMGQIVHKTNSDRYQFYNIASGSIV